MSGRGPALVGGESTARPLLFADYSRDRGVNDIDYRHFPRFAEFGAY
ncbi:hypothetical protein [Rhodococcus qingshengii]|nr:hypothetical protein [Rhodococcus qingshengii]MBS3694008.1 hypothetical protein [Rhodococcus qingshengii]